MRFKFQELIPGVTLTLLIALISSSVAGSLTEFFNGFAQVPVSPIITAIILGILVCNALSIPGNYTEGLKFSRNRILQTGIVLLGIRLSLTEFATIGLSSIPIIAVCIVTAIMMVTYFSKRLGMSPQLGSLIAVGTSICGATAIVATAPTISARDHEVSYAIACITIFGMVAMVAYPLGAYWLFNGDAQQAGLFLGTAVHDTAQVAGAGMVYESLYQDDEALNVATATKLIRNLSMLIVIPAMSIMYQRSQNVTGERAHWTSLIPLFIVGFAMMCVIRTVGDASDTPFGLLTTAQWDSAVLLTKEAASFCLAIAMAAVGLSTSLSSLKSIGLKPLGLGLAAAAVVGLISSTLINILY